MSDTAAAFAGRFLVNRSIIYVFLVWSIVAVAAAPAAGQRCVRIEADPYQATVTVTNGSIVSQSTPADYCDLQPGLTYKLTVFRHGFEKRTLKFSFSDYGQPADISGIWAGMVGRSVVLPGWGQKAMGHGSRSAETWSLLIVDGFKISQVYNDYTHTRSQYDNMVVLLKVAETQQEVDERALRVEKLAMDTNAYRRSLIATIAVGGWVYLHNVVETYLLAAAPGSTRLEGSGFKVTTPKKSANRGALRSLFFPGLGQRYAGNSGRGLLFRWGVFVLALYTIDAKLRYDLAVSDRNVAVLEYNNATSVPERVALLPEVVIQTTSVEERKDSLTAFAVATGCVWLANIIDAWGSGGGEATHTDRFETSTTYRNSTVWQEVRFNF